jgi:hypothetical protein
MNSTLLNANIRNYIAALPKDYQGQMFRWSIAYHTANQKGDSDALRTAYSNLLGIIRQGEQITGIQLLQSPDGSFMCALTGLASMLYQAANQTKTITFPNIQEANNWLRAQTRIVPTAVKVQTKTSMGFFANHSVATQVCITYRFSMKPIQGHLGICEEEITEMFKRGNYESYVAKWEKAHPGSKCLFVQNAVNSRGSSSSVAFGFGLDYIEHAKFFVTYLQTA